MLPAACCTATAETAGLTRQGSHSGGDYEHFLSTALAIISSIHHHNTFAQSFQLIVTKNGKAAVNFEHSWGDGVAVLRYFDEIYKESVATPAAQPATKASPTKVSIKKSMRYFNTIASSRVGWHRSIALEI
jgi:hypothetical protein